MTSRTPAVTCRGLKQMPHTSDGRPLMEFLPEQWLSRLTAATTEHEVIAVVRDYVATWSALELSRLPKGAVPGRIHDPEHISEQAYELTQAHLAFAGSLTDGLLLDRMMTFFTHASARLSQIAHIRTARVSPLSLFDSPIADEH